MSSVEIKKVITTFKSELYTEYKNLMYKSNVIAMSESETSIQPTKEHRRL